MKPTSRIVPVLVSLGVLLTWLGCAALLAPSGPLENYGLLEGAEATHPAFIDGDLETMGETTFPSSEGTARLGQESPPTEAYVLLPEVMTINRIVIHSHALRGIDLLIEDPTQGWKLYDKYDGLSGPIVELKMKGIVRASGIKIRVRQSTGDQKIRMKNLRTNRFGNRWFAGETRALAPISEIEILGPPLTRAPDTVAEQAAAVDEEISQILQEDFDK